MNVPIFLYHLISTSAKETQKNGNHSINHHGLIKLLVERSLMDVSQMEWGVFEDILQFGIQDAPVVVELAVEKEEMGEPSSPIISMENELLIIEGDMTITKEEMVETNMEQPSTSFQREWTSSKRKGKELEGINAEYEPMVQSQETQVSPTAKRHRLKKNSCVAKPQVETIRAATPKVYTRRTRSTTQKSIQQVMQQRLF